MAHKCAYKKFHRSGWIWSDPAHWTSHCKSFQVSLGGAAYDGGRKEALQRTAREAQVSTSLKHWEHSHFPTFSQLVVFQAFSLNPCLLRAKSSGSCSDLFRIYFLACFQPARQHSDSLSLWRRVCCFLWKGASILHSMSIVGCGWMGIRSINAYTDNVRKRACCKTLYVLQFSFALSIYRSVFIKCRSGSFNSRSLLFFFFLSWK